MPTTSNFGWTTPADTDLVKDGAAAIRTLGNGIDTSFLDLKGGTTGQVLSKASNTDLDFTWVAQDDSNAIQNAIVDAKGDLITATAADTPARLAVGADGTYLTADSSTSTGLKWGTVSAGGMTQLATGSLTGSQVDITSISGSYIDLYLIIRDFRPSAANSLWMRVNADSNSRYNNFADSATNQSFGQTAFIISRNANTSSSNSLITVKIRDYANTATWKICTVDGVNNDELSASALAGVNNVGVYNQTSAITQINLTMSSGTFSEGTYILYGVK